MNHSDDHAQSLDPTDWVAFRRQLHRLVDRCVDHIEWARERPWVPPDVEAIAAVGLGDASSGVGVDQTMTELVDVILPFGAGNTHPRFFGWVQGTGNVAAVAAEIVTAVMNSNCGGRDHGATYVERDVIRWCRDVFGLPESSSGVLVAGTSQATVIALAAARQAALGDDVRYVGVGGGPRLTLYASRLAHASIVKAAELLGIGSDAVRMVETGTDDALDVDALARLVDADRAAGHRPFCVVGTSGSVDTGACDDLDALASFCAARGLWFHVDGAFGAWLRIAPSPWKDLVTGIERADSIACDFHKWMFVQYDCGVVLLRDGAHHRATFAHAAAYLARQGVGLAGGDPWFCDYGIDLSRSFRANKVWATVRAYGRETLGSVIARNCELAHLMGTLVEAADDLQLAAPVRTNVCCFSLVPNSIGDLEAVGRLNAECVVTLQQRGTAVFSTTTIAGVTVIRAAVTNHRTTADDVAAAVGAVRAIARSVR